MSPAALPARSLLYVPGDREGWAAKARRSGAGAVILDLEDAVTAENKGVARSVVGEALARASGEGAEWWVRIEADTVEDDLDAVVHPALHTVVVPKAMPALLDRVSRRLDELENSRGLAVDAIGVVGLVESAEAVERLGEICGAPRVRRLGIGEADLAAELGVVPGPDREELAPVRSRVVVASAAAALQRPIGPVHTVLDDPEGLERTSRQQYRQGFRGRTAIHPSQVPTINRLFAPSADEVERARAVVAAFDRSRAAGVAALTGDDGRLLDPATVRRARELVAGAEQGAAR